MLFWANPLPACIVQWEFNISRNIVVIVKLLKLSYVWKLDVDPTDWIIYTKSTKGCVIQAWQQNWCSDQGHAFWTDWNRACVHILI